MKNCSLIAAAFGAFLSLAAAAPARAEGGTGPEAMSMGNMCMVMFGYDMIHITATQPSKGRGDYCEEIPSVGPTTLVFDIENPKFRDYPLEVRIIHDPLTPVDVNSDLSALTVRHIPASTYPKGTFTFDHDFKDGGHYIGLVTLTRENGQKETQIWKFQVGETLWSWVPQIAGFVLIAGMVAAYWKHTHPTPKKPEGNVAAS